MRQNEPLASLIDEAVQNPDRRAAADLMAANGVNFRTVVRVLSEHGKRRVTPLDSTHPPWPA